MMLLSFCKIFGPKITLKIKLGFGLGNADWTGRKISANETPTMDKRWSATRHALQITRTPGSDE
jgi:hypothetical protein